MVPILEMKNIVKQFPGVLANDNVNLTVEKGSIHALMGENGAGKSTLMNILYGLYSPSSGEILFNGKEIKITSPRNAIEQGIGMVHQHFMLIPALSVIENVVLGKPGNKTVLELKNDAEAFVALGARYNMKIDPYALVSDLSVGQQQRVEILKAIYRGAELLVLDEPTAVLTPQEVTELFKIMNQLKEEGKTIIFISHKLNEVFAICDTITVLRLGRSQPSVTAASTNSEELAEMMVGRKCFLDVDKGEYNPGETVLKMEHVFTKGTHEALNDINLEIKKGEILGLAGVDGNGQDALIDAISGLTKVSSGKIFIKGNDMTGSSPRDILEQKVSHIPADRHKRGMVSTMSVKENMILISYYKKPFSKGLFLNGKFIEENATEIVEKFKVKTPSIEEMAGKLSGGNQQKLVLGRELSREPDFIIAAHPVRGLDIGATEYVHECLVAERDRGGAVLLVSTELDEVLTLADRIAVMYEGKIMGILDKEDYDITRIGMMMAGQNQ